MCALYSTSKQKRQQNLGQSKRSDEDGASMQCSIAEDNNITTGKSEKRWVGSLDVNINLHQVTDDVLRCWNGLVVPTKQN